MIAHFYRFSYRSNGEGDPQSVSIASLLGYIIKDVVIKTEQPLEDACPVIEWVKSKPDCIGFSSWDEYSPDIVSRNLPNLEARAVLFDPDVKEPVGSKGDEVS